MNHLMQNRQIDMMGRMKRYMLATVALLLAAAGLLFWKQATRQDHNPHPAERFRRQTADDFSRNFPLGILSSSLPATGKSLDASLESLRKAGVTLLCQKGAFTNQVATKALLASAKKTGIDLILAPEWSAIPANSRNRLEWIQTATPALIRLWNGLNPKPQAVMTALYLEDAKSIATYSPYAAAIATNLIPAFALTPASLAETFANQVPASPVLCCTMPGGSGSQPLDFNAFVEAGERTVTAASSARMTPIFTLSGDKATPNSSGTAKLSWRIWTSAALGARGILFSPGDEQSFQSVPLAFSQLEPFRPLLGRIEPCTDYLGKVSLIGAVYPGDLARLFYDTRKKTFIAIVVLSPLRPPNSTVRLRGGTLEPVGASPAMAKLKPGQGGFYRLTLSSQAAAAMQEARSHHVLSRAQRDQIFIPTYGSRFSVLCDKSLTPRILHCKEPVALLAEPNVRIEPMAGSPPVIAPPATHYPGFRKVHVSGFTLYRISLTDQYRRIIILEEDGSTPGFNERVASMANVGVTRNGICPIPLRTGIRSLPAQECYLTYDLDAFRAISGLNPDYPLYFQFDGSNTRGTPDQRFHVWVGPDTNNLTPRVSPGKPTPLVFLSGSDKWLKIGMPYKADADSHPVLQRWNFFTWIQSPNPASRR